MNTRIDFEIAKLLKEKEYPFEFINVGELKEVPLNIPTIAKVVMWLNKKHGVWVWVKPFKDHAADVNDPYWPQLNVWKNGVTMSKECKSITEAYLMGIKYALKELI